MRDVWRLIARHGWTVEQFKQHTPTQLMHAWATMQVDEIEDRRRAASAARAAKISDKSYERLMRELDT